MESSIQNYTYISENQLLCQESRYPIFMLMEVSWRRLQTELNLKE